MQHVKPGDPLADGVNADILSLIGPRGGIELALGDHQRWTYVRTPTEDIIERVDVVTSL